MHATGVDLLRYLPVPELLMVALVGLGAAVAAAASPVRRGELFVGVRRAATVLLIGAVLGVLVLTLLDGMSGGVNLVPGRGIASSLSNINRDLGLFNILGNTLMLAPLGFLYPLVRRVGWLETAASCAAFSVSIEVTQLLLGRSADVDDVLLNTLGGALGAAVGVATARWLSRRTGIDTVRD